MAASPSRGALLESRGAPPITAPLLYARRRVPAEAFAKYDKTGSGVVNLEDMRASFSALGLKLSLQEAKALVHRQSATGDKGAASRSLAFNYRDFLQLHGAETSRAEAAKGERNHPEEHIDVHNPPPQPSAAHLIIERLQRERAPIGEGWMCACRAPPSLRPSMRARAHASARTQARARKRARGAAQTFRPPAGRLDNDDRPSRSLPAVRRLLSPLPA